MHRSILAVLTTAALLGIAGCRPNVDVVMLASPRPAMAPRPASEVELITTGRPTRTFVEVAVIRAQGGRAQDHYGVLRARAGELGCDALVLGPDGESVHNEHGVTGESSHATCILWSDAPAADTHGG